MEEPIRIDGDQRLGASDTEFGYELMLPAFVYPLFETCLRAAAGRSPSEHAVEMGRICARMSAVASENPLAWSRDAHAASSISQVSETNRYIGYPYTKLMNANMNVDQAAALLLTTEEEAKRRRIPEHRWVYPMGGAGLNDVWHISQRPRLDDSPAIRTAGRAALDQVVEAEPDHRWDRK